MRTTIGVFGLCITVLVLVLTGMWLSQQNNNAPKASTLSNKETLQAAIQASQEFYLIRDPVADLANLQPGEFMKPREGTLFGTQNSSGVEEAIAAAFPALLPDFVMIGDDNSAREQFLIGSGYTFQSPDHYYKTEISNCKVVNGETRVLANVYVGRDTQQFFGGAATVTAKEIEVRLSEIWKIDQQGGAPILLDRIRCGYHDGAFWEHESPDLRTTIEAPPTPQLPTMSGQ